MPVSRPTTWLSTLTFGAIRLVARIVPRRDRAEWQREWEAELRHHAYKHAEGPPLTWRTQWTLFRRALGSVSDAAWFRRQFTRDNEWVDDVRFAMRQMRRYPRFHLAAALMLAAGIGSTAAGLSLLDRLVLRALPYDRPEELVAFWQQNGATGNDHEEVAPGNFLDWRASATSLTAIAAAEPYSVDLTLGDRPEVVHATRVTQGFFDILAVDAIRGRLFAPEHFIAGAPKVTVISHAFWLRLGGDPALIGGTIRLDNTPVEVLGVLPRGAELNLFDGRGERDVWLPKVIESYEPEIRGEGWWAAIGRLKPGVTRAQAQAEIDVIASRAAVEHPRTNGQTTVRLAPLETITSRLVRPALTLLLFAAALVLVIACANVANLLMVRSAEREHEFAVRGALGASRGRLVRQALVEAVVLAGSATIIGIGVAWLTVRGVVALAPQQSRMIAQFTLDAQGIGIACAIGVATVLLFGIVPALQRATSVAGVSGSRWATGSQRARRLREFIVVAEIAVAVVLAVGVGLLSRSLAHVAGVDPGFDRGQIGVVQVFAYDTQDTDDKLRSFQSQVLERLMTLPGVRDVGSVSAMPLIAANINIESPLMIEGRPAARPGEEPTGFLTVASPGYFSTMGIGVVAGRALAATDDQRAAPVVTISRTLAARYWPGADPLGQWIGFEFRGERHRRQVVGVVEEVRHDTLELPARDEVFIPFAQAPFGALTFVYRAGTDPAGLADQARAAIWESEPRQTIYDEGTVEGLLAQALAPRRFAVAMASAFALAALLLAGVGVYTTMTFVMARQVREFGVRLALGASPGRVGVYVLRQGLALCAIGVTVGLALAMAGNSVIRAQLVAVSPFDPPTLLAVATGALLVTAVACAGPARRAMRTDPARALRSS